MRFFLAALLLALCPGLAGVQAQTVPGTEAQLGAHGLRLPATFTGTLPCADCDGIAYHLDLWPDQGYHLRRVWLGRGSGEGSDTRRDEVGRWHADAGRDTLVLPGPSGAPERWQVRGPETLRLLDTEGNPILSDLPYDLAGGALAETDIEDVFLSGMMVYMADAALFTECATGRRYPVVQEGDYLALERAYIAAAAGPGAPLHVHVTGGLVMRPAMEGPDRRSLEVTQLHRTLPGTECSRRAAPAALTGTYWRLDSLRGQAVTGLQDRPAPHLVLQGAPEAQRFRASVGCNQMIGSYTQEGAELTFGAVASTMMACPPELAGLEQSLGQTLEQVRGHRRAGDSLLLLDAAGALLARLTGVYLP